MKNITYHDKEANEKVYIILAYLCQVHFAECPGCAYCNLTDSDKERYFRDTHKFFTSNPKDEPTV